VAISQEQKVDFLLKKIGYTKTKTGLAVDSSLTGTKKAGFAEALPSPLIVGDTSLWTESGLIPTTPPGSDTSQVKVYLSGSSGQRLTVDSTVADNRAFIAYTTYNNTSSARLTNWIDTQFGDNYLIKVYKGDPNSGGVQLSASGSGANDGWFFDYSAGVLNFNDTNVPSGVTSSNIYIVGYRYIGNTGAPTPGDDFSFRDLSVTRNLSVTGLSTFTGVGTFISDLHVGGDLTVKGTTKFEGGTLTLGDADTDNIVFGGEVDSNIIPDDNDTWDLGSAAKEWRSIYVDDVNVSGVSTFAGNIDANGRLDVDGVTELDDLNVSGVSTIASVNVSGASTFAGAVDINNSVNISSGLVVNSGATLDSAQVSDLTDNRVVIAGAAGELEDDANLTFNGTTLSVGVGLDVDGHTELDDVNVSGAATFTSLDINGSIDIDGVTELDDVNISGVSTIASVNVTGLSTFTGTIDANGSLDVDGVTELDVLNVAEIATFSDRVDINSNLDVSGVSTFASVNVTGLSTFAGLIDSNGGLDVTGHTEVDTFNASGIATALKLSTGSDGVGITTNVISGPATLYIDPSVVGDNTGEVRIKGDLYVDGTQFSVDSSTIQLADYRIGIGTTAPNDTALDGAGIGIGSVGFEKTFVWESSASSLKSSEHLDLATGKVYKINGTSVLSNDTLGSTVVNSSLTNLGTLTALEVNGHTEVDNINVAGFSTFVGVATFPSSNVYIENDLFVSGIQITGGGGGVIGQDITTRHLNVTGFSTFANDIDANGRLDVDGVSELDDVNIAGVSTIASVNVTGLSTFTGNSTFSGNIYIPDNKTLHLGGTTTGDLQLFHDTNHSYIRDQGTGDLRVRASGFDVRTSGNTVSILRAHEGGFIASTGIGTVTRLYSTHVNVSGVSTFAGNIDANGRLDVDGVSELDDLNVAGVSTLASLNVSGLSTFTGIGTFISDLHVGGDLTVKGTTKFEGGTLTLGDADTDNIVFGGEVDSNIIPDDNDTWALGSASKEWKIIYVDDVNVTGVSTISSVNVTGLSTFVGFSTFTGDVQVGGALTVAGTINSLTDITINGVSVGAGEDPVAMAIALG